MTTTYTAHYGFPLIDFAAKPWHEQLHDAFRAVDAILYAGIGVAGVAGIWENDTAYVVGNREIDSVTGIIYTCAVGHTSRVAGAMSLDRTAHPTYWTTTTIQLSPRGEWANATVYNQYDIVYDTGEGISAICSVSHTSSAGPLTIRDDSANWIFLIDLAIAGGTASTISYDNATSGLVATDVQAALDELVVTTEASQAAIAMKADIASPTFTGSPRAPTQSANDSTTLIATTAMVQAAITALIAAAPGALNTLDELAAALGDDASFATTMTNALALKAPLASPTLTGTPLAPTAVAATSNTQIATTAHVHAAIAVDAPAATVATQAEQETGTSVVRTVTPGRQHYHASAAKAWGKVTVSGGTPTLAASYNITSITDNGVGDLTVTYTVGFSGQTYAFLLTFMSLAVTTYIAAVGGNGMALGYTDLSCFNEAETKVDPVGWLFGAFGDQ